ncbi:hypothetical protein H310_14841 [Aphanomyces invadans]|uniref:FPL domain-containing protein n=1 Tax=Aphanomyces invadans TaxID=157072 RepID=A0A024T8E8_9STRA|nr:hypothetical protein H310_14841 [Aphanomyces invadans]ETV90370.1 hypothetical protein H310_14841 [Aphanomyces invadans]|eukprot:XP_008881004.1 hypothetical protein H310_14841 [Aphanomyces invadans]
MFSWFKKATMPNNYSFDGLKSVHMQLLRHRELSESALVELLRVSSEFLIYSDQHSAQQFFFEYFCEKNMLALFVQIGEAAPPHRVQVQLLQTLSLLVQNISTTTSLYYILSNNYINRLMTCRHFQLDQEDVRDWYVTFLKALSIRLNVDTVQFFFNAATRTFPLYIEALKFRACPEIQVQIAVKTVLLNVLRVPDDRMRRFLTHRQNMPYFMELVDQSQVLALKMQGLLNTMQNMNEDKLHYVIDATIDHWYYMQDILDVPLPDLTFQLGEWVFESYLKGFVAHSLLPNCHANGQRISTLLALFLLLQFFQCITHTPLLNAATLMLFHPDAHESSYMSSALGAGGRKPSNARSLSRATSFESSLSQASPRQVTLPPSPPLSVDSPATHPIPQSLSAESLQFQHQSKQLELSPTAAHALKSPRFVLPKLPPVGFQPHQSSSQDPTDLSPCSSSCYLVTRFAIGEWPPSDVLRLPLPDDGNSHQQSLLALLQSSDSRLSLGATALLAAIASNKNIDKSLLKECHLKPVHLPTPTRLSTHHDEASSDEDDDDAVCQDAVVEPTHDVAWVDLVLSQLESRPRSLIHVKVSLRLLEELTSRGSQHQSHLALDHERRLQTLRQTWALELLPSVTGSHGNLARWDTLLLKLLTPASAPVVVEWPHLSPFHAENEGDQHAIEKYLALHVFMSNLQLLPAWRPLVEAVLDDQQHETAALRQAFQSHTLMGMAEISFLPCMLDTNRDDCLFCILNVDAFVLVRPGRDMTSGEVQHLVPLYLTNAYSDTRDPNVVHVSVSPKATVSLLFQSPEMAHQALLHLNSMKNVQVARKWRSIETLLNG